MASMLFVLPRTSAAYGAYILSPLLLVRWRISAKQAILGLAIFAYSALSLFFASSSGRISITSYLLEMALLVPLLLFVLGARLAGSAESIQAFLRIVNVTLAILSIVKMPFDGIPYVTVLPDQWNALFGLGGAKILTIVGFFGVLQELLLREHGRRISKVALVASLANLVIPSYLLGVAAAAVAVTVAYARRLRVLVPILAVIALISYGVVADRSGSVSNDASMLLGVHPKLFAYQASADAITNGWLLGAGPGQLGSTPQTWLDPGLAGGGSHSIPSLPGLHLSESYREWIAPYTQVGVSSRWVFNSSLNQPVTGWAAILGEWGIGILLLLIPAISRVRLSWGTRALRAATVFTVVVNVVDPWFDAPWFGAALLVIFGLHDELRQTERSVSEFTGESSQRRVRRAVG